MLNKVVLQGRLPYDLELKETPSGKHVTNFVVAVQKNYKNSDGNFDADWVDCSAWGKLAETICKYFVKGSQILIDGRLNTRIYKDSNGNSRKITEVIVEGINFVDSKKTRKIDADDIEDFVEIDDDGGLPF